MGVDQPIVPGEYTHDYEPPVLGSNTFAIKDEAHGMLVYGSMPVDFMGEIFSMAKQRFGRAMMYPGMSWTLRAAMALSNDVEVKKWQKELGLGPDQPDWLKSCDIGTSALTIYSVLFKKPEVLRGAPPCLPRDSDDFGRCFRLIRWLSTVNNMPEARDRLVEVSAAHPRWKPIIENWDVLCRSFEAKRYAELNKLLGGR